MLLKFLLIFAVPLQSLGDSLSTKDFVEEYIGNQDSTKLIKVDLVIIQHLTIEDRDLEEKFTELKEYQYSPYLLEVKNEPTKLIPTPTKITSYQMGVPKIELKGLDQESISNEQNTIKSNPTFKPFLYERVPFEVEMLALESNLNRSRDYRVLYYNTWYQPALAKSKSIPIHIESRKKGKKVYGEIHLYKERFFHLDTNLRFAEETNQVKEGNQIPVIDNFQNLYNESQKQERRKGEDNYWMETIFNTVQVNIQNIINYMNEYQPISEEALIPVKDFYYEDLYEIDKEIKLETDTLNFIDHPYFSVLARVKEL